MGNSAECVQFETKVVTFLLFIPHSFTQKGFFCLENAIHIYQLQDFPIFVQPEL